MLLCNVLSKCSMVQACPVDLSGKLLQLDESTGDFSSAISFTNSGNDNFHWDCFQKQQEIRDPLQNRQLPQRSEGVVFLGLMSTLSTIEPCGPEGFEIGPDVEDKPLPGSRTLLSSSLMQKGWTSATIPNLENYSSSSQAKSLLKGHGISCWSIPTAPTASSLVPE